MLYSSTPPQLHQPRGIMSDRLHVFQLAYHHAQIAARFLQGVRDEECFQMMEHI